MEQGLEQVMDLGMEQKLEKEFRQNKSKIRVKLTPFLGLTYINISPTIHNSLVQLGW